MAYQYVEVSREDHLTVVTINRPDKRNALSTEANFEMKAVFDDFENDPEQWVAIVTGKGDKAFCAGADLAARADRSVLDWSSAGFGGLTKRFTLTKPVIAAVNGFALGGGFELTLACDLVVAAETASFGLPEPARGIAALAGGLHRLPRIVGRTRAMSMILTARRVTAVEGLAMGFVNEVVPLDQLDAAARRWAAQILELAPMAVRGAKQVVDLGLAEASLEKAMATQLESPAMMAALKSEDAKEGPRAFVQKRKPDWKNR